VASTTTALDIISGAMKLIGALPSGESARPEESADALERLNDILETWRLDRLMVYNVTRQTFPLVASQQLYTIGVGGNFNIERPVWLDPYGNSLVVNYGLVNQFELPLTLFSDQQWSEISMKSMATIYPQGMWFNQSFPLSQLYFWPIPTGASLYVALMMPMEVLAPVTLTSVMTMPPGYQKALRYALAVELAQEFGRQLNPMVLKIARETKASVMGQNESPTTMRCDSAMTGGTRFSIYDGGFGRR
jgi:hypothetical protein